MTGRSYYYGSYGLIRGYGPLCRYLRDADESVYADAKHQRDKGGNTDRCVVLVSRLTGLCWWIDDLEIVEIDLMPVRELSGNQAQYPLETIHRYEELWG